MLVFNELTLRAFSNILADTPESHILIIKLSKLPIARNEVSLFFSIYDRFKESPIITINWQSVLFGSIAIEEFICLGQLGGLGTFIVHNAYDTPTTDRFQAAIN